MKRVYAGYDGENLYLDFDRTDMLQIFKRTFMPVSYIGRFAFQDLKKMKHIYLAIPTNAVGLIFLAMLNIASSIPKEKSVLLYLNQKGQLVEATRQSFWFLLKNDQGLLKAFYAEKIINRETFIKYLYKMNERYPF